MTKQEKKLLIDDLCARLRYGVKARYFDSEEGREDVDTIEGVDFSMPEPEFLISQYGLRVEGLKPYLRPMSSMTMEERIEFSRLLDRRYCEEDWEGHISTSYCIEIDNVYTDDEDGIKYPSPFSMEAIDWLNAHYFDYRGLIKMGFALEAPEGMYETKSE